MSGTPAELDAGSLQAVLRGGSVHLLTFAPSGRRALLSGSDGTWLYLEGVVGQVARGRPSGPDADNSAPVTDASFLHGEREALVTTKHPEVLRVEARTGRVTGRRGLIETVVAGVAVHPAEPWVAILVADVHGVRPRIRVLEIGALFEQGVEAGSLAIWPLDPDDWAVPESRVRLAWWDDDAILVVTADGVPAIWTTDGTRSWMSPPRRGGSAVACVAGQAGLAVVREQGVLDEHPAPLRQVPARSRELPGAPLIDAVPDPTGPGLLVIGEDGRVHSAGP